MKRKYSYLFTQLIMIIGTCTSLQAQVRELKIGDKMPAIVLNELLFSNRSSLRMSELKGKLIIFDFWTINCSPCVRGLPEMEVLQKKFGDKVLILPVITLAGGEKYNESKKRVQEFWTTNRYTKDISIPTLADTILNRYFPHKGVPYEVWIGPDGTVAGLTQFVNEKEILSVLEGNKVKAPSTAKTNYDYTRRLLQVNTEQPSKPANAWYTAVTSSLPNVRPNGNGVEFTVDSTLRTTSLKILNRSIVWLYIKAFQNAYEFGNKTNRILVETNDSTRFFWDRSKDYLSNWHEKNDYCYQAILPGIRSEKDMRERMLQDLNAFFELNGRVEKREVDCWTLVRTSDNDALLVSTKKFTSPKQDIYGYVDRTVTRDMEEINSIDELRYKIDANSYKMPVLNETGLTTEKIRLLFEKNIKRYALGDTAELPAIPDLRTQLTQYGLDLVPVKRTLEVLVITEKEFHK